MSDNIEIELKEGAFSKESFKQLLNWFFSAVLAFIAVMLSYIMILGSLSYATGFDTHIHFTHVDSLEHDVDQWDTDVVLALFALPSFLFLLFSAFLYVSMLSNPQTLTIWKWFKFWFMAFSVLLSTTLMSVSVSSASTRVQGPFYQGFAPLLHWFGASPFFAIVLLLLSFIMNVSFGFIVSPVLMYLAPSDFIVAAKRRNPNKIVFNSFIYTLPAVLLIAILLSLPDYYPFFVIMFFHAVLWLPGLFNISSDSLTKRQSRPKISKIYSVYLMTGLILFLLIIIRIFLK
jgi:hypothetical protein